MKIKALLYCTKSKPMLRIAKEEMKNQNRARCYSKEETKYFTQYIEEEMYEANGKIVAECDFEVEDFDYMNPECLTHTYLDLLKKSCLTDKQIYSYLKEKNGYAIHIKNLHIFDKPKELSEYYTNRIYTEIEDVYTDEIQTSGSEWVRPIKKAPQNMMYAKETIPFKKELSIKGVLKELRGFKINEYVIISIQPQWLCKILNGEKTIEVRKKVLKEMLK